MLMRRDSKGFYFEPPKLTKWIQMGQVAKAHDLSPAQSVLKWHLQRGLSPIVKTSSYRRLEENLKAKELPDFTDSEMERITSLDRQTPCDFTSLTSPDRIAWNKRASLP